MIKKRTATAALSAGLLGLAMTAWIGTTNGAELDPQMLVGNWTITQETDDGPHTFQIRIENVDTKGRATGTYCSIRPDGSFFGFHLRPKGGVRTKVKDGELKFGRSKRKYALSLNDDGTLQYHFKSKTHDLTRTLTRTEEGACLAWFARSGESFAHTVAEADADELVGVWAGKSKRNLKIEVHVASVNETGEATALYCWTRKDRSMVAFRTGPGAPTQTVLEDGTLKAPRGNVSFDVTPQRKDRLQFTFRKGGNARNTRLKRSEAKGCLTHIRMLETTS